MMSVIIPVRNGAKTILECLSALGSQSRKPDEIIVVDNGSTDHTLPLVKQWMLTHAELHPQLLSEARRGPSAARNRGARSAKGEVLVFLDADCMPSPDWLKGIFLEMERGADAVGGPCVSPSSVSAIEKYAAMSWLLKEENQAFDLLHPFGLRFLLGANMSLLKRHWQELQGFDESLCFGEDIDLSFRLKKGGRTLKYLSRLTVTHHATSSLGKRVRRAFFHGMLQSKIAKRDFPRRFLLTLFEKTWQFPFPFGVAIELHSLTKVLWAIGLLGVLSPVWAAFFLCLSTAAWEFRRVYRLKELNVSVTFLDYLSIPLGWAVGRFSLEAGRLVGAVRYGVLCL